MRKILLLSFVSSLFLAACATDSLVDQGINAKFPNNSRFAFRDSDNENVLKYACQKGETEAATLARAKAAHRLYDTSLNKFSNNLASETLAKLKAGQSSTSVAASLNRKTEAWARKMQMTLAEKYQCVFYERTKV